MLRNVRVEKGGKRLKKGGNLTMGQWTGQKHAVGGQAQKRRFFNTFKLLKTLRGGVDLASLLLAPRK